MAVSYDDADRTLGLFDRVNPHSRPQKLAGTLRGGWMNHIEAHRLVELAEMSVIADQPEIEHIRNCDDCSIAFLQLRDMLVGA